MSIIGQRATTATTRPVQPVANAPAEADNPYPLLFAFLPIALLLTLVARHVGVFRRRSVDGPPRVGARESMAVLLMLGGMIVFLWLLGQMALAGFASKTATATSPANAPATVEFTPQGLAMILIAPPLIALGLGLLGHASARPDGPRLLGLGLSQLPRGVVQGLVGGAIMIPLVFLVAQLVELLWRALGLHHQTSHELLYKMRDAPDMGVRFGLIAAAVVVAPLWEEFLFRGHLQTVLTYIPSRLRYRTGGAEPAPEPPSVRARWASILVTSLCFAAIHYQPGPFPYWMMPPIFFLSLCVGYAYERTGNLWTTITMHAMFNGVSTILYFAVAR